jgi:replication factor A1
LFSIDILDASATDIRATLFKEAVDKFYSVLEVDKVYTFTGGRLKTANIQYNTCKSGFEITFDQNSEIHLDDDNGEIQQQTFEFVQIAQLEQVEPGKYVDILAVVKSVGEVGSIVSKKSGQELKKCELVLVDDSGVEVTLTVWGEEATKASTLYADCPIVGFKRSRVSDFGGRSLSANSAVINPRLPETERVRAWWQSVGSDSANPTRSLSSSGGKGGRLPPFEERKSVASIKNEHMGQNTDKFDWVSFKGTFNFIKKDKDGGAWYPACANAGEPCKNRFKVTQTADGNWYCDKCQGTFPTCVRRFIFSATITDDTSTTWVSLFNEQAEVLLGGVTADEVYKNTHENHDQDAYDAIFSKATFTDWVFNCKVRQEFMNDEARTKTQIQSLHPVDYVQESRNLLQAIALF